MTSKLDAYEGDLRCRLKKLQGTQTDIVEVSQYVLANHEFAENTATVWLNEYRASSARKMLILLYLANDVIQNGRRNHKIFLKMFSKTLPEAFSKIFRAANEDIKRCLYRLLNIWQERGIYPKYFLDRIRLQMDPTDLDFERTSENSSSERSNQNRHHHKRKSLPQSPSVDKDPLFNSTNDDEKDISTNKSSINEPDNNDLMNLKAKFEVELKKDSLKRYEITDILKAVKDMQSSASMDAEVRQKIAHFPEDVVQASSIQKLKVKNDAAKFLDVVLSCQEIVDNYNDRLTEEVKSRKDMLTALKSFTSSEVDKLSFYERKLQDCEKKFVRADGIQRNCNRHVENLPDIGRLIEDPDKLGPLPSLNDLFK